MLAAAAKRLNDGFASDPALAKRFRDLAQDALEILVGDVAEPGLDLTRIRWSGWRWRWTISSTAALW